MTKKDLEKVIQDQQAIIEALRAQNEQLIQIARDALARNVQYVPYPYYVPQQPIRIYPEITWTAPPIITTTSGTNENVLNDGHENINNHYVISSRTSLS